MPRNCWTRCNKTFPCSFPAREKTREIESRETSRCLEKQAILALLRKMIYKFEFTLRLSDEVFDKIGVLATREHRSMTNYIEYVLLKHINDIEAEQGEIKEENDR